MPQVPSDDDKGGKSIFSTWNGDAPKAPSGSGTGGWLDWGSDPIVIQNKYGGYRHRNKIQWITYSGLAIGLQVADFHSGTGTGDCSELTDNWGHLILTHSHQGAKKLFINGLDSNSEPDTNSAYPIFYKYPTFNDRKSNISTHNESATGYRDYCILGVGARTSFAYRAPKGDNCFVYIKFMNYYNSALTPYQAGALFDNLPRLDFTSTEWFNAGRSKHGKVYGGQNIYT